MASLTIVRRWSLVACASRPRWYGRPAGTKLTRSRWKASASSVARRRCPKWIGSKVPPKRPGADCRILPARSSTTSGAHLAVAQHDPLLRGEALEPNGPARVQLVGRDADLGAQAVLVTVGEAGRRVHHHRARVDLAQEPLRARVVLGHDRVGVLRAVLGDVSDRL